MTAHVVTGCSVVLRAHLAAKLLQRRAGDSVHVVPAEGYLGAGPAKVRSAVHSAVAGAVPSTNTAVLARLTCGQDLSSVPENAVVWRVHAQPSSAEPCCPDVDCPQVIDVRPFTGAAVPHPTAELRPVPLVLGTGRVGEVPDGLHQMLVDFDNLARELRERVPMELLSRTVIHWDVGPSGRVWCGDVDDVAEAVVEARIPSGTLLTAAELMEILGRVSGLRLAPGPVRSGLDEVVTARLAAYEGLFGDGGEQPPNAGSGSLSTDEICERAATVVRERARTRTMMEAAAREVIASRRTERPGGGGARSWLGEGDPVVVVNAVAQPDGFWHRLLPLLARRRKVFFVDPEMCGPDGPPIGPDGHLAQVRKLVDDAGLDRYSVLGWCTGGKTAVDLAFTQPRQVTGVVLLAASLRASNRPDRPDSSYEKNLDGLCRMVVRRPSAVGGVRRMFMGDADKVLETVEEHLAAPASSLRPMLRHPFSSSSRLLSYARELVAFWEHDVLDRCRALEAPVLTMIGGNDQIVSLDRWRQERSWFATASARVLPGATHYLMHDQPDVVAAEVLAFLDAHR